MDLAKDYVIKNVIGSDFEIDFLMPDNCEYVEELKDDLYNIYVALKDGQTQPSSIFLSCTVFASAISDELHLDFVQTFQAVTSTKPRIRIVI